MEQQVTGLPAIIAKLITLWDMALSSFASVKEAPIINGCQISAYHVNVSETGEALTTNLANLVFNLVSYLSQYFAALIVGMHGA